MGMILKKLHCQRAQGTVEFAIAFPVLIVVAVVSVNALLFMSECAAFDREAMQAVRAVAASPAYNQDAAQGIAQVNNVLAQEFQESYLQVRVEAGAASGGLTTYVCWLEFSPTLFGMGLRDEVWGVPLPHLRHSVQMTIDPYKPGVFF